MSEFDRQTKLFKEKVKTPDKIIKAHSLMKSVDNNGNELIFWFLSDDDTVTMVDMRDEEPTI